MILQWLAAKVSIEATLRQVCDVLSKCELHCVLVGCIPAGFQNRQCDSKFSNMGLPFPQDNGHQQQMVNGTVECKQ